MDPDVPRDATNLRKVALPHDPELKCRYRDSLAELDEKEGRKVRSRRWEREIDGVEEEEGAVVEGVSEGVGVRRVDLMLGRRRS